jgi:hypothetical protein
MRCIGNYFRFDKETSDVKLINIWYSFEE